jgi:hypothetical protein
VYLEHNAMQLLPLLTLTHSDLIVSTGSLHALPAERDAQASGDMCHVLSDSNLYAQVCWQINSTGHQCHENGLNSTTRSRVWPSEVFNFVPYQNQFESLIERKILSFMATIFPPLSP